LSKSIDLDIPTDPAERVRQQDEYILKQAHRDLLPVVVMQKIADAIVKRAEELQGKNLDGVDPHNLLLITDGQLSRIIMQEFDKELG
jgi:hypothetical protein